MKVNNVVFDKDKLFFTSDTHFGHENIIKYCNRPFKNVFEMNQVLVDNWNKVVPKDGVVFHLGDFALNLSNQATSHIFHSLNGTKHLVIGNHEKCILNSAYIKGLFNTVNDISEIFVKDDEITYKEQHIVMCHYPMITWNASHRGSWQLFGHVHGGLSNKGVINHPTSALDVGVDNHNFTPLSYEQVKLIITKQNLNGKS